MILKGRYVYLWIFIVIIWSANYTYCEIENRYQIQGSIWYVSCILHISCYGFLVCSPYFWQWVRYKRSWRLLHFELSWMFSQISFSFLALILSSDCLIKAVGMSHSMRCSFLRMLHELRVCGATSLWGHLQVWGWQVRYHYGVLKLQAGNSTHSSVASCSPHKI